MACGSSGAFVSFVSAYAAFMAASSQLARGMNAREPRVLGDSLMLLWEGAFLARVTMGEHGPVQGAAKAARALIAAYTD